MANPKALRNSTRGRYLDAMAAWLEAAQKDCTQPSWEMIIEMLEAAKIYE